MTSIYQIALGKEFNKLHPQIQRRLKLTSTDKTAVIGRGIMEEIWHGRWYTYPFLGIGTWRNIMFPETGKNISFQIENFAFRDAFGRETVSWIRSFHFPNKTRRFDATMIFSNTRKRIIDYLGTHQHLAVDLDISVDDKTKGIRLHSGEQRFYEGKVAFKFAMAFSGYADVCEWFDDDEQTFKIEVRVRNRFLGDLFGYRGSFMIDVLHSDCVPFHVIPHRTEVRE